MQVCDSATLKQLTTQITDCALKLFGDKLDKIVLYGSYARGDAGRFSDIDIMILADVPADDIWQYEKQLNTFISRADMELDTVTSAFVKDSATFYRMIDAIPFYQNIINEGVSLYAG